MDRRRYTGELIIKRKSDFKAHWFFRVGFAIALAIANPVSQSLANDSTDDLNKTETILFGGYGSTNAQMKAWEKSAAADPNRAAAFNFHAVALPSKYFSRAEVKRDAESTIRAWVNQIKKAPAGKKFVLTGHSSGSAVANEIICRVAKLGRDPSTLKLVILDGFAPNCVSDKIEVQCLSAVDVEHPAKGTWNQRAMKSCQGGAHQYREVAVKGCKTSMCLHFATMNSNANQAGINSDNYKARGYSQLRPNLDWLDAAPAAAPITPSAGTGAQSVR